MSVYYSDRADADRTAIRATLGPRARAVFDQALARAAMLLTQFPEAGRKGSRGTREHPLTNSPFTLVYRVRDGDAFVLAIRSQRRGGDE